MKVHFSHTAAASVPQVRGAVRSREGAPIAEIETIFVGRIVVDAMVFPTHIAGDAVVAAPVGSGFIPEGPSSLLTGRS